MRPILLFAALVGLVVMLAVGSTPQVDAAPGWWDSDWEYRASLSVGEWPGGYQLRMTLDESDNFNNNIDSATWDDIRFIENDTTPLDYWIENLVGDTAVVWVELPLDNSSTVNIYYGNSGASAVENGNQTFLLFDEFDSFDNVAVWGELSANENDIHYDAENGTLRITEGTLADYGQGIYSVSNFTRPFIYEFDVYVETAGFGVVGIKDTVTTTATATWEHSLFIRTGLNFQYYDPGFATVLGYHTGSPWERWGFLALPTNGGCVDNNMYDRFVDNHTNAGGNSVATLKVGAATGNSTGTDYRIDNAFIRRFASTEPTYSMGAEEEPAGLNISAPTVDNAIVDRKQDNAGSTAVLATQISVQFTQLTEGENVDSLTDYISLYVKDNSGNTVIDNIAPIENTVIDENTLEYSFTPYNPADGLGDADLGGFTAYVIGLDNAGSSASWGYSVLFTVDDMSAVTLTQENLPGHQHKMSGTATTVSGGSVTLTSATRVDNNTGQVAATYSGTSFDNTYAPVTGLGTGSVYFNLRTAELDGSTATVTYNFPNIVPEVISFSAGDVLIDRDVDYGGSGADTTTVITIRLQDNDNRDDFVNAWIAIRDNLDVVVENDVYATMTNVNENQVDVTLTYDATENTIADAELGLWDVSVYVTDNWNFKENWEDNVFTVDDLTSTITHDPTDPYTGWFTTVSGSISRISGAATTADSATLIDNVHGSFAQGADNDWTETYQVTAIFMDNVSTILRMLDAPLDGIAENSFIVNENAIFQVEIRWENTGELVDNFDNHEFEIKFWWDQDNIQASDWTAISDNIENFTVSTSDENVFLVRIRDNTPVSMWRSRVPTVQGGVLVFLIPGEDDNVFQYSFTLLDYTTLFYDGWVRLYHETGIVNEDWWDASELSYSYLIYQEYYKVRLVSADGTAEYEIQHFQAESDLTPPEWQALFYEDDENTVYKYEIISVISLRDSDGYVDAQWTGDANATSVTVNVYGQYRNILHTTATYWGVTTVAFEWTSADNENIYWVEVETDHEVYGTWSDWFPIAAVIEGSAAAGGLGWGLPIALATFAGFAAIAVFAMLWTKEHSNIAPLALMLFVIFLKLSTTMLGIQLMPSSVGDYALGGLFILAVIWAISEALD